MLKFAVVIINGRHEIKTTAWPAIRSHIANGLARGTGPDRQSILTQAPVTGVH